MSLGKGVAISIFLAFCINLLLAEYVTPVLDEKATNRAVDNLVNNNFEIIVLSKENVLVDETTKELFYIKRNATEVRDTSSNVNIEKWNIEKWNVSSKAKTPMKELFSIPDECKGKKIVFETFEFILSGAILKRNQVKYAIGASCS